MFLRALTVLLSCWAIFSATPAVAQGIASWIYNRAVSTDPAQTQLSLAYGIPFSDGVAFTAGCEMGAAGPYVSVTFFALIGPRQHGQADTLTVGAPGAADFGVAGQVFNYPEMDATGLSADLAISHPLFQAMASRNSFRFGFLGLRPTQLPLDTGHAHIRQFLADCPNINQLRAETSPALGQPEPLDPASNCARLDRMQSRTETFPLEITFTNTTHAARVLFWLDHEGQAQQLAYLYPGQQATAATFVTHPMLITDENGTCQAVMEPQVGQSAYQIEN